MADSQKCVTCGIAAPETQTHYTLISAQFGWRLTRYKGPEGTLVLEWRCPTCWRDFKRSRVGVQAGDANAGKGKPDAPSEPLVSDVPAAPLMPRTTGRLPR